MGEVMAGARALPRPYSFPWGGGQVVEEASVAGEWHEPTIQLLESDEGGLSVRFCSYTHSGRFQRNPLVVSADDLQGLRKALEQTPRLRELLSIVLRPSGP
jgi:hypothetical protein